MKHLFSSILLLAFLGMQSLVAQTANRPDHVADQLYVKLYNQLHIQLPEVTSSKDLDVLANFPALHAATEEFGLTKLHKAFRTRSADLDNIYTFHIQDEAQLDRFMRELNQLDMVEYAEYVPIYYPLYTPNDFSSNFQWFLDVIDAEGAWDISQGSDEVVIAIVDNAVDVTHVDLAPNIWTNPNEIAGNNIDDDGNGWVDDVNGWDVADNDNDPNPVNASMSHGTHVAGCASAATDNGTGVAGIGFSCKIMGVKATPNSNPGGGIAGGTGVDYAISSGYVNVVNMSYGGYGQSGSVQSLINAGVAQGIVFVGGAGNDDTDDLFYPASYDNVISVGGTAINDSKSWFSNYGTEIDVMAPGSGIRSTVPGNSYAAFDGTSMSSPITAGLVGLMLSANPCLTPAEVEQYLKSTCDNIDAQNASYVGQMGAGRINAAAALAAVQTNAAPVAAFTTGTTQACGGELDFSYDGSVGTINNCPEVLFWDFGNGQTATGYNATANYASSGTYTVTLVANNSAGTNTSTQQITVDVNPLPVVDAGQDMQVCFGDDIQLAASSDISGTFQWTPNIGLDDPNVSNPTLAATSSRFYYVSVTTAVGCTTTDTIFVEVVPGPSTYAGLDVTIQQGGSTQLQALGAATYEWSPTTGLSDPNIANPVASPSVSTLYTVTGYSAGGCPKTDDVLVTVDGTNSIQDDLFAQLGEVNALMPNPAQERFTLSATFQAAGDLNIKLLDVSGKQLQSLYKANVQPGDFQLDWERDASVAAGFYLVVWEMKGARYMQKLQLY